MLSRLLQFKITLKDIKPEIWRRIIVPEKYSFWDLHVAIQDVMGWKDYHLHAFHIRKKHSQTVLEIGIPDDERFEDDPEILKGWEVSIKEVFHDVGVEGEYEYDFGDSWIHRVLLEAIVLHEKGEKYPKCIGGARACSPEDCGGIYGYQDLLSIISDPGCEEYASMMNWLGGSYDPEAFNCESVKFDSPLKRWKIAFK